MRILLVQAFTALDLELVYPIGLASLAAHLGEHEVRIFDLNQHRSAPLPALERVLTELEPEVVGISLRNIKVATPGSHADDFGPQRDAVRTVRRLCPDAFVVLGGTAFSLYAQTIMERLPEVDCGVWGEAELRFPRLLEHRDTPWEVPGVYWREGDQVRYSGAPPVVDFAALPPPRRELLPMAPYSDSSFTSVGVQTKRGCALRCVHCSDTWLMGNRVRARDPGVVVDEIEHLVKEHGVHDLFFCDAIFNIPPSHARAICEEIVRRRLEIRWAAWFNEHRHTLPDELMSWVKRSGCQLLSFSPDHVDDRMLEALDKNFGRADLEHTLEVAKRWDLDVEYSFFLNTPGETPGSMLEILRWLAHARTEVGPRLRMFTLLMMQPIRLYPHTRLTEQARELGLVTPDDDLVQARFWNPAPLSLAVAGLQVGAALAFRLRHARRLAQEAVRPEPGRK